MVLRSSPWESRTSLTNKGHFRVAGRRDGFAQLFAPRRLIGTVDHCEALFVRNTALFVSSRWAKVVRFVCGYGKRARIAEPESSKSRSSKGSH